MGVPLTRLHKYVLEGSRYPTPNTPCLQLRGREGNTGPVPVPSEDSEVSFENTFFSVWGYLPQTVWTVSVEGSSRCVGR